MLTLRPVDGFPNQKEYTARMERFGSLSMTVHPSVMSLEESRDAVNVNTEDGTLRRIGGFGPVTWGEGEEQVMLRQLPAEINELFEFRGSNADTAGYRNLYYAGANGQLYRFVYNEEERKIEAQQVSCTTTVTGHPYTYFTRFVANNTVYALLGGPETPPYRYTEDGTYSVVSHESQPRMKKTTMHYSRMFGVGDPANPNRVWFSSLDDPTDFTVSEAAGGYIDINDTVGDTMEAVSFFDTLLVFCRNGIMALDTLSVQGEFSMENLYFCDSEILEGSICVCGSGVLFATRNGVYCLSGRRVTCVSGKIRGFFTENKVIRRKTASVVFRNRYFLTYQYPAETDRYGLLILNMTDGTWQIFDGPRVAGMIVYRDADGEKLLTNFTGSRVVFEWNAGDYLMIGGIIESRWTSPKNDWGMPHARKTVREVHFSASGNGSIRLTVTADNASEEHTVSLTAAEQTFHLPLNVSGDRIGFTIENRLGCDFCVSPLTFIYTASRESVI